MAVLGKREETAPPSARINPADAHTILGREAKFNGKLAFSGAVRIDGKFEGEIETKDLLLIGPGAEVKASLKVGSVVINGSVEGDIVAKASVEIKAPGRLKGNVSTPALIIEKGVLFDGTCKMSSEQGGDKKMPPPPPANG
ncbi:MAG: polymer-forming cytoskeletal protein [Myxococcota bacterium]